ncbi:hypothetical protein WJX73_008814 [Symbiochloris irregularis]|uniref:Reverse transcriptase domain-containing protein n=1 Tax=Symbiochloris irregularis TaxID=706552 RepID=A0AAW1PCU6_9CHLO
MLYLNALDDAKMSCQNIMTMYIDFSSAFNTIDHDKLLVIMHKLGFPEASIEVIADLYNGAQSVFQIAGGETEAVTIDRGTLQGDSLSPLLFIIFMEPLLRWLQSGGRGYKFACTGQTLGSTAYADDLNALTHTATDLAQQAHKVDMFAKWGDLKVNVSKCAVSGVQWGLASKTNSSAISTSAVAMMRRQLERVKIDGNSLPFLHPDKEPYPYLGVLTTLTMNWSMQMEAVMKEIRNRAEAVLASLCSPAQKLQYLQSNIKT